MLVTRAEGNTDLLEQQFVAGMYVSPVNLFVHCGFEEIALLLQDSVVSLFFQGVLMNVS